MSAASLNPNTIQFLSPSRTALSAKRGMNFLLAVATAVGMTFLLFVTMEYIIRIEKIELAKATDITIGPITVDTIEPEPIIDDWLEVKIEAPIPPAAPPMKNVQTDTSVPPVILPSIEPLLVNDLPIFETTPHSGPSTAIAIRQPIPNYPRKAAAQGLSGSCSVAFSLDARGTPFNVAANCTDAVFVKSAERAVAKAAFSPTKNAQGLPIVTHNMVFPLEYKMN